MKTTFTMHCRETGKIMDISRFLPLFEDQGIEPEDIDMERSQAMGLEDGGCYFKFVAGERSVVIKITAEEFECLFSPHAVQ